MTAHRYTDFTLYGRLLRQARPYLPHIGGLFLLSLLSTPLALLAPLPIKIVVDSVIGSHPLPAPLDALPESITRSSTGVLILAVVLLIAVTLLSQLQDLVSSLVRAYTGEKLVLAFRAQLFRHAQRLSFTYHDTQGTMDATYRIQYDAPAIQYITIDGVIPFVTAGFTLAGMIYVTVQIDGELALVSLTVVPVLLLLTQIYRRRLRRQSREVKKLESGALAVVQEVLTAIRVVKAFRQEDREQDRFLRHSYAGMRARIRLAVVQGSFGLLIGLTTTLGTAAVLVIGVSHVQARTLTLGELLLVVAYLSQLYAPLKTISKKSTDLQASLAGAERAFALLDEHPDVPERPGARPLERARGAVTFSAVCFGYSADRLILRDVSFAIAPGTRVGIAGMTGAGKTTIVNLLTRFYDPTAGQILLDGVDLRDYQLTHLRNQFAIVLQEPVLFSASIAENIAYGRPDATREDIVCAAQAANAHEFIRQLPQGYDTLVGERGMRLSGGERQRVSLARAFLKNAPILILDEPTSSVDMKTEAAIMEAMERLMRGRTSFMIAHRTSTLTGCDTLLLIEQGRLVLQESVPVQPLSAPPRLPLELAAAGKTVAGAGLAPEQAGEPMGTGLLEPLVAERAQPAAARVSRAGGSVGNLAPAALPQVVPAGGAGRNGGSDAVGQVPSASTFAPRRSGRGGLMGAVLLGLLILLGGWEWAASGVHREESLIATPPSKPVVVPEEQAGHPPGQAALGNGAMPLPKTKLPADLVTPSPRLPLLPAVPPTNLIASTAPQSTRSVSSGPAPLPTLPPDPASAAVQEVISAENSLRSGYIAAQIALSAGTHSAAQIHFDLGEVGEGPRLDLTSIYTSTARSAQASAQTVELIMIGERSWQRTDRSSWQPTAAESVLGQLRLYLPAARAATNPVIVASTPPMLRWYDPMDEADVTLERDPNSGLPRALHRTMRQSGLTLDVLYIGWNTAVEIRPPPGPGRAP
jgi:ATP-binding cassette subfamily B protein